MKAELRAIASLLLLASALAIPSGNFYVGGSFVGFRGGAKEEHSMRMPIKEAKQPASAIEVITLDRDRGFLVRKVNADDDEFFVVSAEQDPKGSHTLQLVRSSSFSGRKAHILKDAVESLKDDKEFNVIECDGIFGVYQLPSGYYLALITKSSAVGRDSAFPTYGSDTDIREIDSLSLLHIPFRNQIKTANQTPSNARQVGKDTIIATEMLLNTVSRHSLYFVGSGNGASLGYDITRNMQSQAEIMASHDKTKESASIEKSTELSWKQCDERFFWNLHAVECLSEAGLDHFIIPVTNAWTSSCNLSTGPETRGNFIGRNRMQHEQVSPKLGLISRRSRHRQGQRYIKRGSDGAGDVANFVETEQILFIPPGVSIVEDKPVYLSHVQVRGSIPIFWTQPETWRLKPAIVPMRNLILHARALKTHLVDLFIYYFNGGRSIGETNAGKESCGEGEEPTLYFVNLIDKSGMQGRLGKWLLSAFERVHRGGVDCINRSSELASVAALDTTDPDSERMQLLAHFDELPLRLEREAALRDRKHVTVRDFTCTVRAADMLAVGGMDVTAADHKYSKRAIGAFVSRFVWFDYHKMCSKGAVRNLAKLFAPLGAAVAPSIGVSGKSIGSASKGSGAYAMLNEERRLLSSQRRLVRTNCVDCLDRTNVVQTTVARWVLISQLEAFGLLRTNKPLRGGKGECEDTVLMSLDGEEMESQFRQLWGNNGDAMSLLYAGTPALKRDITRTGKRTNQGVFDDGMNSAMRYYINNMKDERTQKALDFTLGHHALSSLSTSSQSFSKRRSRMTSDLDDREFIKRTVLGSRGPLSPPLQKALAKNKVRQEEIRNHEKADSGSKGREKERGHAKAVLQEKERHRKESVQACESPPERELPQGEKDARLEGRRQMLRRVGCLLDSLTANITALTKRNVTTAASNSSNANSSINISRSISHNKNNDNNNSASDSDGATTDLGTAGLAHNVSVLWLENYLNGSLREISTTVSNNNPIEGILPMGKDEGAVNIETKMTSKSISKKKTKKRKKTEMVSETKRRESSRTGTIGVKSKELMRKPLTKVVLPSFIKRPIVPEPKQQQGALEVILRAWKRVHPVAKIAILLNLMACLVLIWGLPTHMNKESK